MHTLRIFVLISVLLVALISCKKDDGNDPNPTAASQTDLLVANNWRTVRVTTPDGQEINKSRLNLNTQVLYDLNMQFRKDGSVRALDPSQSNSVVNGGSWKLTADNQSMDVDVQGFKGNFPIIQLTKSKLILRQSAPVDGKTSDINLEFNPTL
ncbi:hypothetical protein [Spirosoma radiotolerans]|uniref:Lipocalin-like domain-containing protein n=1 Tax=Spirosoma radiotolerans TaxID=1379870 RepID=A0A0E3ZUL8_9BACT|nr:hypothetical protein [Spirosoma radiotolerans]AKD55614.1 hypothetical protein SD10_12610 [Spirosoma radiotolerans]